jgi:hypothetical protein
VVCLGAQVQLPATLPIEDVLASDGKGLRKIKDVAFPNPIVWHAQGISNAGIEVATRLGALPVVPAPTRMRSLETRLAHRRVLSASKLELFECGEEVFDKLKLCTEITDLTIAYLSVREWIIRTNSGAMGWLSTDDFVLLQQLRNSVDILTDEDLEDEDFRDNLRETISTDLPTMLNVLGNKPKTDFLNEVWISGGLIEAAPHAARTAPATAFSVSPAGQANLIGAWERLFLADHEPFASIHPAFLPSDLDALKTATMLIAEECATKRFTGTNVIHFWESDRELHKKHGSVFESTLTPEELHIAEFERVLPHYLVEYVLGRPFDEASMSFGPDQYVYVQDNLQLPGQMNVADLTAGLIEAGVTMDDRVHILPEFTGREEICLVVKEATPERLIALVYHILTVFADVLFGTEVSPAHPIYAYCHAIEFLKNQTENRSKIHTSVLAGRKKETHKKKRRVFHFSNAGPLTLGDAPDE